VVGCLELVIGFDDLESDDLDILDDYPAECFEG